MGRNQIIDALLNELGELAPAGYVLGLHFRFAAPLMMFQTYDPAWTDHYTRNAYALRDPMIAWGLAHSGATRWSDIDLPDPFGIMNEAAEFGLGYGVCVSCGPLTLRTIAGLARNDREFDDEEISAITGIVLRLHHETKPPDRLPPAEREPLQVIADGDYQRDLSIRRDLQVGIRFFQKALGQRIEDRRDFISIGRGRPESLVVLYVEPVGIGAWLRHGKFSCEMPAVLVQLHRFRRLIFHA